MSWCERLRNSRCIILHISCAGVPCDQAVALSAPVRSDRRPVLLREGTWRSLDQEGFRRDEPEAQALSHLDRCEPPLCDTRDFKEEILIYLDFYL